MTTGPEHRVPLQGADTQVNVVAESSDDGTYELRVERGGTGQYDTPAAAKPESGTAAAPVPAASSRIPPALLVGAAAVVLVSAVSVFAFRGEDTPEPDVAVDEQPAALETTVREFQVFQIGEQSPPTLPGFALARDVGTDGDGADAGEYESPDAEQAEAEPEPVMIVLPDDEADDDGEQLDPLTVERMRNVRIELQPDDPVRAPPGELPEHWSDREVLYDPDDFGIYVDEREPPDPDAPDDSESHADDYE